MPGYAAGGTDPEVKLPGAALEGSSGPDSCRGQFGHSVWGDMSMVFENRPWEQCHLIGHYHLLTFARASAQGSV